MSDRPRLLLMGFRAVGGATRPCSPGCLLPPDNLAEAASDADGAGFQRQGCHLAQDMV